MDWTRDCVECGIQKIVRKNNLFDIFRITDKQTFLWQFQKYYALHFANELKRSRRHYFRQNVHGFVCTSPYQHTRQPNKEAIKTNGCSEAGGKKCWRQTTHRPPYRIRVEKPKRRISKPDRSDFVWKWYTHFQQSAQHKCVGWCEHDGEALAHK